MCGIMGYVALNNARPSKRQLIEALNLLQIRGTDATGIYLTNTETNEEYLLKLDIPASMFTSRKEFRKIRFDNYNVALFHVRAATHGRPEHSVNNHPITNKEIPLVVIHNGILYNHETIYQKYGYVPDGQVDSEAFIPVLKNWDIRNLEDVSGTFAIAVWNKIRKELLLARHAQPLILGFDIDNEILYFASTDNVLNKLIPTKKFLGLRITLTKTLLDDTSMIINVPRKTTKIEHFRAAGYGIYSSYHITSNTKLYRKPITITDTELLNNVSVECPRCKNDISETILEQYIFSNRNNGMIKCDYCFNEIEYKIIERKKDDENTNYRS